MRISGVLHASNADSIDFDQRRKEAIDSDAFVRRFGAVTYRFPATPRTAADKFLETILRVP
ncbi:MAG: hypothetical protein BGP05_13540 [Rhizobiales bacterium 62-47]|nr:MAG: hypothetical protein BGP05_13540 [Rhizobiales bacterium 62-47]